MNIILSIGILIFTGYIAGELAEKIKLPKISGYILAGILLNPDLSGIMSYEFVGHTDPLLSISLSIITFSIGGSLSSKKRFYHEFNGIAIFKQKDVYGEFFHNTAQFGGWLGS